jgi:Ca2+-binding EF-hand superfamily protein
MLPRIRFMLLLGAVLVTGASASIAEMNKSSSKDYGASRSVGHFMADYDLNRDGKVTKDEFNRALGQRFAAISHGQPINEQQFAGDAMKKHRERAGQMFRRADWNGDGKLTLDEYVAPLRAKFSYADRKGTSVYDCAHRGRTNPTGDANRNGGKARRHGQSSRGMCFTSDLNQDGKVTHTEYDAANAKRFAEAAHGGKTLTFEQFASVGGAQFQETSVRIFHHLDVNSDGKLTIAEFAASKVKLFARLDMNKDGAISRGELASSSSGGGYRRPYSTRS